ncbi:THO complex subunit 6 homolog [Lepeophtheirus salmonis]|uniref:THO complex subunit 6 homolog n=1 Tax=Lepeophtheirus salmonis TaxID=72036 RepID=UPI001AE6425A|nr:THO complex subunit 6 homolog [Lepeophtheirus salmonis]
MSQLLENLPPQYSTVYSTCFSPDGGYLVAGNQMGLIALFSLESITSRSPEIISSSKKVHMSFLGHENKTPIYALLSTKDYLISGSVGKVTAWSWNDLIHRKTAEMKWEIFLPPVPGTAVYTEVNSMCIDEKFGTAGRLIVAGGDNNVHTYDLETREELRVLSGHDNFIHSSSYCPVGGLIASGSEDGSVRLWDTRKKVAEVNKIEPYRNDELSRPKLGKWIGAVALSSDWLVCGGGARPALWHLRSMSPNAILPPESQSVTVLTLLQDRIIIGGLINKLYQTDFTGNLLSEIPVTPSCLYSISTQEKSIKVLAASGSSSKIDLCIPNFSYKDQTITFPSKFV